MDKTGRLIGMLIFIAGIAILIFVFFTAYGMFNSTTPGLSANAKLAVDVLGGVLINMIVRLFMLFIMTLAGSLIAARGISLYTGSPRGSSAPKAPTAKENENK